MFAGKKLAQIREILISESTWEEMTCLFAPSLTALDFKPYQLHDQNERTPIGGKIVFQRWHDSKANRDLMKIEYVYQSAEQLRNADALTLQAPAQRVTLELSGCPIDADGFCPMDKFDSVLNEAVK